jgi:hypothetical protein
MVATLASVIVLAHVVCCSRSIVDALTFMETGAFDAEPDPVREARDVVDPLAADDRDDRDEPDEPDDPDDPDDPDEPAIDSIASTTLCTVATSPAITSNSRLERRPTRPTFFPDGSKMPIRAPT